MWTDTVLNHLQTLTPIKGLMSFQGQNYEVIAGKNRAIEISSAGRARQSPYNTTGKHYNCQNPPQSTITLKKSTATLTMAETLPVYEERQGWAKPEDERTLNPRQLATSSTSKSTRRPPKRHSITLTVRARKKPVKWECRHCKPPVQKSYLSSGIRRNQTLKSSHQDQNLTIEYRRRTAESCASKQLVKPVKRTQSHSLLPEAATG